MFVHSGCTNSGLSRNRGAFPRAFVCQRVPRSRHLFAVARALPSPTMFRFLFARCQAPFCPVGLHLRPDLLFRCLTHRAKTALRPSSLLCSSVSLANRTFPPLRPPNLHVSKRHDVWILAIGHFNHPPDTHLLKIQDLLGSFRNSTRPQIDSEVRIAVRLAGRHRTARSAPQATGSHDADFADSKMPPLSSVFYGGSDVLSSSVEGPESNSSRSRGTHGT